MPVVYLANGLYDKIVRMGENPTAFVKKAVIEKLEKVKDVK
jgi:hypothetical protein